MAHEPQTKGPNVSTHSVVADFIGTVWGKVLTVLAAITMLLGIAAEGVSLYRNWWEAQTARQQAIKTKVETDALTGTVVVPLDSRPPGTPVRGVLTIPGLEPDNGK
jgi:hypothetical protein